ncbi:hypothetical protein KDL01_22875 [Actinospica durhamensis]|uniref:Uncharacterized protein n=1 Tax=Actinospica durhamensis TaxID=1508375 RepID=A0A941EW77_9ACTN|nr:hypothetical protein [Actinospica durhamensis]MBR7836139.1 hypothetical protein [Actinospica durhamensis]
MGSVLDRLGEREAQARVLVERLRGEAERAAGALAAADVSLSRLVIARETVAEVLEAEPDQGIEAPGVRGAVRDVALYERIAQVFAEAGAALRPRQVCEALGMPGEARYVEAMRPKLSRLVADGVLAQVGPGLFAPAAEQVPA